VLASYALLGEELKLGKNVYLVFDDSTIVEVGFGKPDFVDEVHEYENCLLMPGLVNCHVHMLHSAFKSMLNAADENSITMVRERKKQFLGVALRSDLAKAIEEMVDFMLRIGTTTILDFVEGGVEKVNLIYNVLSATPINFLLLGQPDYEFSQDEVLLGNYRYPPHSIYPLIKVKDRLKGFGLPNPMSIPIEALRQMARIAEDHGLMKAIHVADIPPKPWEGVGAWKTQTEAALDFYRADTLFHANYIFDEDVKAIAERGSSVVCCTRLTQVLGLKPAPIDLMIKHGVNVVLGTGSPMVISPNMMREMEATYNFYMYLGKPIEPIEILKMATVNSSRALREKIGVIEEGYRADIVVLRLDIGGLHRINDVAAFIVKNACELNVLHVYVAGKRVC